MIDNRKYFDDQNEIIQSFQSNHSECLDRVSAISVLSVGYKSLQRDIDDLPVLDRLKSEIKREIEKEKNEIKIHFMSDLSVLLKFSFSLGTDRNRYNVPH
ncbi:hypothetical protein SSS_10113 [Sarcoptes scabiei]|nr:hypothetical protein SSS_10113 [Sarcoptes scabiei]